MDDSVAAISRSPVPFPRGCRIQPIAKRDWPSNCGPNASRAGSMPSAQISSSSNADTSSMPASSSSSKVNESSSGADSPSSSRAESLLKAHGKTSLRSSSTQNAISTAVRHWPANCGPNKGKAEGSQGNGAPGVVKATASISMPGDNVPVVIIDDEDEDEAERCKKRQKTSAPASDCNLHNTELQVVQQKIDNVVVLDDPVGVEQDLLDPDERWVPNPSAITKYVGTALDWVIVSQKKPGSGALLPSPAANVLHVTPLKEKSPEASSVYGEDDYDDSCSNCLVGADDETTGDARKRVADALQIFEKIMRLRCGGHPQKAGSEMNKKNLWVNRKKRFGSVPGVEVGDVFFSRMAMCVVGLHKQTQAGISSIQGSENEYGEDVACSLVLSGGYEDNVDDGETFIYSGHGGQHRKKQVADQKLERANLALANSCKYGVPVRVVRGFPDSNGLGGKMYTYSGLYRVLRYWPEQGVGGYIVFKYFLKREPQQPELCSSFVKFVGRKQSKRKGVVCEDISGGMEPVPISAVNHVDEPAVPPTGFTYITKVIFPESYPQPPVPSAGCRCKGACNDSEVCRCISRNGGKLPYDEKGTLLDFRTLVYECGPHCRCPPSCPNKVTQRKPTRNLEVFKTADRGWGVRSLQAIPYGSFICEYVGEMIDNDEAERRVGKDEYIFDIDCIKGSQARGIDISGYFEEPVGGELCEQVEDGMSIDALTCGNVTRFINHSCDPNLFVQCVFYDHYDLKIPHIMLFAMKAIRPLEELSYDYAYRIDSVKDASGNIKMKPCFCGARNCRKRLY